MRLNLCTLGKGNAPTAWAVHKLHSSNNVHKAERSCSQAQTSRQCIPHRQSIWDAQTQGRMADGCPWTLGMCLGRTLRLVLFQSLLEIFYMYAVVGL